MSPGSEVYAAQDASPNWTGQTLSSSVGRTALAAGKTLTVGGQKIALIQLIDGFRLAASGRLIYEEIPRAAPC